MPSPTKTQTSKSKKVAAITGASSGLGREFARQLAARGYDLLLIARRQELLEELKTQLESEHAITVELCVADLAKPDELAMIEQRLMAMDNLELMVNNAGFGLQRSYPDVDIEAETDMLRVHCIATARLSQAALLPMCQANRGNIINVSSVAAFLHGAAGVQYYATKAYILSFTKSLQCDVARHGVRVQALCPGLVHTGFHDTTTMSNFEKGKIPTFLWLPASFVVKKSLAAILDSRKNRVVCVPSIRYRLLLSLLTSPLASPILNWMGRWRSR